MGSECAVHDCWRFDKPCNCSQERKWTRKAMLQELLVKISPTIDKQDGLDSTRKQTKEAQNG